MLQGKKILLGITGSIAAYKAPVLLRLLIKAGADVKVIMTKAASDFVTPLTLSTLSKKQVATDLFDEQGWENHVALGRRADLFLIAPASCNSIAKMASGICDNLLTAVYLSATCPVWFVPAMDEDMWQHPATKRNIAILEGFGNTVFGVDKGELASGLYGEGRMTEPEMILSRVTEFLNRAKDLEGKKILITAGPTQESIDPVRYISNRSSGKMGFALARACTERGAEVFLVKGPVAGATPEVHQCTNVITADEMFEAAMHLFPQCDIGIFCAAVADYKAENISPEKIKKVGTLTSLTLWPTRDILKAAGSAKTASQLVIGFALETENEEDNAMRKLHAKSADLIVLNSLADPGAGFGGDTNKITIFGAQGLIKAFATKSKAAVASDIIDTLVNYKHA